MKMRPVGGGRTLRLPQLNSPLCANMTDEQVEWSSRSLYIFTVKWVPFQGGPKNWNILYVLTSSNI